MHARGGKGGDVLSTDGLYAETKEVLTGSLFERRPRRGGRPGREDAGRLERVGDASPTGELCCHGDHETFTQLDDLLARLRA